MKKKLDFTGRTIEYELTRKKVKNLNLRIRSDGTVHISAPYFTPQRYIDRFVLSNADRIFAALERIRCKAQPREDRVYLAGQAVPVVTAPGSRNLAVYADDRLTVYLRDISDAAAREKALAAFVREFAIRRIEKSVERIYPIFAAMNIKMPEIKYRRMKSRWGSCRYTKASLSFNTALAHVPEGCIDYVVMHEFCHFIRPDHSPEFHALMSKLMPDWKMRKKALEKYSALL